jgi:hypothetical protein
MCRKHAMTVDSEEFRNLVVFNVQDGVEDEIGEPFDSSAWIWIGVTYRRTRSYRVVRVRAKSFDA